MSAAKPMPGPWMVFGYQHYSRTRYVVLRECANGREYLTTPNGNARTFGTVERARAAIAKAKGGAS
jgi:hypothetical protein